MIISKQIWFVIFFLCQAFGQQIKPEISNLKIDIKQNGVFVQMKSSIPINIQNVTGWSTETGWFYITILNAISDSVSILNSTYKFPITNIQTANSEESTQIALRLEREVESFEFYQSDTPPEILLSLRFPVHEVFVQSKNDIQNNFSSNTLYLMPDKSTKYKRIRTGLYLVGTSLTIAGAMDMDNSESMSWELPTGLIILTGTYFFDTILYPRLNKK